VTSFTLRWIYPRERTLVPTESEAGWGPLEKSLILCLCQVSKQDTPDIHPTSWSLTILTELRDSVIPNWLRRVSSGALVGMGEQLSFPKELDNMNEAVVTYVRKVRYCDI